MRVILDTNVWISALLFQGIPRQLLILAEAGQIQIYTSEALLEELDDVLKYPKLQKRIQQLGIIVDDLISVVQRLVNLCPIVNIEPVQSLRDPDDWIVLATAVAAQAIVIVSGDRDLLVLENYAGIAG
jgi:hypothetical protein